MIQNNNIKYVLTGEVKTGTTKDMLKSSAIGSCVVVVAYDINMIIGGMAHIMLPGIAPNNTKYDKTRYAVNAIDELENKMSLNGADINNMEFCVIGGANVLKRKNDTIAQNNVDNVIKLLVDKKYNIVAQSVGGTDRRSATINIKTGQLVYTIGDESEMLMWNFLDNNRNIS